MNGSTILLATDILSDAGGSNVANIKLYKDVRPMADGYLHLEFLPNYKEVAFVNAIEIVPGTRGTDASRTRNRPSQRLHRFN